MVYLSRQMVKFILAFGSRIDLTARANKNSMDQNMMVISNKARNMDLDVYFKMINKSMKVIGLKISHMVKESKSLTMVLYMLVNFIMV